MLLIERTWALCQQVLCPKAASSMPDHEIARVYAILESNEAEGGGQESAGNDEGLLVLLSNSWRSMKEAG